MKTKIIVSFLCFIIVVFNIILFCDNIPLPEIKIIPCVFLGKWKSYNKFTGNPPIVPLWDDVYKELEKRYYEAWKADKSKWPECIKCVFKLLGEKKDTIKIRWNYVINYNVGSKNSFLDKEYNRMLPVTGDVDGNGEEVGSKEYININNVYKKEYHYSKYFIERKKWYKNNVTTKNKYPTAGIILHELIHLALDLNEQYGVCKNKKGEVVDSSQYEPKVEDCTSLVFPNDSRPYEWDELNPVKGKFDDCNCKNTKKKFGKGKHKILPPGGDNPDDNYSYSTVNVIVKKRGQRILIFDYAFSNELNKIVNGLFFNDGETATNLSNISNTLIFPTGSLFSNQNNTSLKETLRQYVQSGGTIIVFAQQYGRQVENIIPVPEGEKLKVYGWREDQSCYNGSVYGSIKHPALSSLTYDRASAAVDGYIDKYPEDSVVLLRRTKNRKPALLYYKYGEGTVILTTLYTDWGYAHSQASGQELNIVRDLLTFARDVDSEIPMYNITETANPKIKLNLKLKNDTEYDAVKAKIRVLTPSRELFKASKPKAKSLGALSKPCSVKLFNPLLFIKSKELRSEIMKKQNNLTKMVVFFILKYCPKRGGELIMNYLKPQSQKPRASKLFQNRAIFRAFQSFAFKGSKELRSKS